MAIPQPSDHTPTSLPAVAQVPSARLDPVRRVLDNGVVVTARETRKTPAVTINLAMNAGTVCDPPDRPGAIFLLSRLLDRGTEQHSADEVAEALESRGISLSIGVNRHQLSIVCTCLSEDFADVFAVLGEILVSANVPEHELVIRKGEVATALAQDEDSPYVKALLELMVLLYGPEHPYGRPAKGTVAALEAMTREDLLALHRHYFRPSALSVVVVGDVPPSQVADTAARVLGSWRAAPVALPPLATPPAATTRQRRVISMMNKSQADVAYGFTTIRRSDPTYYACALMNNILGQYAMGGRLGDSIRERQGMAYYVSSAFDASLVEGPLMIRAGVAPANVDRAIASIDEELARIRRDGVTARELTESRQYLIGSMPRALETNAGIANFLQSAEFFQLGLDYDVQLRSHLSAVTLDEVHAAAQQLLDPDRAAVVIAGPYQDPD